MIFSIKLFVEHKTTYMHNVLERPLVRFRHFIIKLPQVMLFIITDSFMFHGDCCTARMY